MVDLEVFCEDYSKVEKAIAFLEANLHRRPMPADAARHLNLSEHHFQKLFSRWAGIRAERFFRFLTKEYGRQLLYKSENTLDADGSPAGLSGGSGFCPPRVASDTVTAGEYRRNGLGLHVVYGFFPSPFGKMLLAETLRGVCALHFVTSEHGRAVAMLAAAWPGAMFTPDPKRLLKTARRIFGFAKDPPAGPLHLYIRGTEFQIKVWKALLKIPTGFAVSYTDIARHIGQPQAARAVGNAVGRNPISFLIPCHRVIRRTGDFGHYGSGRSRKKAILGWEAVRRHACASAARNTLSNRT